MGTTLHVVSHTHWDREWYLTYQQFRMRLVDLVDRLLALLDRDPEFRYFNLDAQTIVLEDYLAIKPQNRAKLERYVREGRITIGPWYQLNDEFLTSGEATIRSLLVGTRLAQQFGACLKIGYLPDQFGNLSQMPQIFRGFGIDNAIVGRGYQLVGDRKMEFLWESPDGSQVTTSLMGFWYNNAQRFPADPERALRYVADIRDRMAPRSHLSHLLLMNGVDHLEAQYDLSPILKELAERLPPDTQIVHSTLPQYIAAMQQEIQEREIPLKKMVGELREDRGGAVLAGTLSARMYLKQANHHAQITLEKFAEPFASFAMQTGAEYPYEMLHYAWKLLMNNHPHDSICGCSIDQVHREMMPRFEQVEQIGEEIILRSLQQIASQVAPFGGGDLTPSPSPTRRGEPEATSVAMEAEPDLSPSPAAWERGSGGEGDLLIVFNSLNWTRADPVRTTLTFPLGVPTRGNPPRDDRQQVQGFTLTDASGAEIPFAVTNVEVKMRTVLNPVELPLDQWVQEFTIEFVARDVPPCGYKAYAVTPRPAMPQYPPYPLKPSVEMKRHEQIEIYGGLRFVDTGDVGDEYLHRKPLNDQLYNPGVYESSEHRNPVRFQRTTQGALRLPASSDALQRSSELVDCPVVATETIYSDVPRAEYQIELDNQARDHRLQVFAWSADDGSSYAESAFDVIKRSPQPPHVEEGASAFYPQGSWVDFGGVAFINSGTPEYEIYETYNDFRKGYSLAVTLLRCVGYLSRRGDGPQFETPDAQCIGRHVFHFAKFFHEGDWQEAMVWRQAHQFNAPLRAVQTTVEAGQNRALPPVHSFLTIAHDALVATAMKRAEDDPNTLIVRFYNITETPAEGARITVPGAISAHLVNLNEETQQELTLGADGTVTLETVRPKQIITLAFRLAE